VLADIIGIYANIGKVASMVILLLFFLGVDLFTSSVVIVFTVTFAGAINALDLNHALINVISLSVSNSIHVGEIISLGRPGFDPPNNPGEHVTGFLEGVTWGHVIIRDFKRKQVFIRHAEFGNLIVQNWSRRPNKDAHFIIPIVPEFSGGVDKPAKLAKYAGEWIKEHPFIDQEGYQKSVIKWSDEKGLILEAIFFPALGGKARQIRAEFVVMILDAAKRLGLCLLPAEIRTSSAWPEPTESDTDLDVDLKDLDPSPELTERAGFKPKRA
jgi:small-conductance mechanosensitive channel